MQRDLETMRHELSASKERELDYDDMRQKYIEAVSSKSKLQSVIEAHRAEKITLQEEKRRLEQRVSENEELLQITKSERDQLSSRNDALTDELAQIREQLAT